MCVCVCVCVRVRVCVCVCVYTCLRSDHLVCFSPGFPFSKSFRDGCSLGTFSRFDLFLQPILRGKAEAKYRLGEQEPLAD